MFYGVHSISGSGGSSGVPTYANFAAFPSAVTAGSGALALALDTDLLYASNGTTWAIIGGPGVPVSIGAFDSGTPSAQGAHIDSDALIMQSASATVPGLVNTTTQTFAGVKTFSSAPNFSSLTASLPLQLDASKNVIASNISLTSQVTGTLPIANGGTGQTTAQTAIDALLPSQTSNSGKFLTTNGTTSSWGTGNAGTVTSVALTVPSFLSVSGSPVTTSGTLAVTLSGTALPTANGGTGVVSTATFPTSGVVVTEAGTETLTNKTIGLGNTIDVYDTSFTLEAAVGSGSARFNLDVLAAGLTRTLIWPTDSSFTPLGTNLTQTVTNKTISGASNTITNVSLTTGVTGILPTANGGTGQNSTATFPTSGIVVTEAATETLTNKTISGASNTITNVSLTTGVTGTLPVGNGGTGITSGTSGGVPYFSSTSTIASSGALTASAIVLGGGAGAAPTSLALGTANQVLGMNSGATANEYKTISTGTTGTDFAVAFAANSIALNLPDASATARGVVTTGTQTMAGIKTFSTQLIGKGTATNDNAAAGFIGEYLETVQTTATNFSGVSGDFGDLGSISLTAGDWMVSAGLNVNLNGSTTQSIGVGISSTSGNSGTGLNTGSNFFIQAGPTTNNQSSTFVHPYRVNLTGTTTYYCKVQANYTAGTPQYRGRMSAWRTR